MDSDTSYKKLDDSDVFQVRSSRSISPSISGSSQSLQRLASPMLMRNSSVSQSYSRSYSSYASLSAASLSSSSSSSSSSSVLTFDEYLAQQRRYNQIRGVCYCLLSTTFLAFNTVAWEVLFDEEGALSEYFTALQPDANTLVTTLAIETVLSLVVYTVAKPIVSAIEKCCCADEEEGGEDDENDNDSMDQSLKSVTGFQSNGLKMPNENNNGSINTSNNNNTSNLDDNNSATKSNLPSSSSSLTPPSDSPSSSSSSSSSAQPPTPSPQPSVSVLRYNFLACLGAVLYFCGFCCRLIGISYLSAITFAQMEPARIVYIFVLKVVYIVCCMPSLHRAPYWLKDIGEALAMTVLDGDEQDGTAARKRLFRAPVLLSMCVIFGSLLFQMYASLTDGAVGSTTDYIIGFTALFACLLFNACENVWWEVVSLHPDIDTLSFLQRHDQYLLGIASIWSLSVIAASGFWFEDVIYTMLIAGGLNALTVPASTSLESMSLEKIDSLSFSSIQELCYPFFTLLFALCVYGSNTLLPDTYSWIAMCGLAGGIIAFHFTQTLCTAPDARTKDDDDDDDDEHHDDDDDLNDMVDYPTTIPEGDEVPPQIGKFTKTKKPTIAQTSTTSTTTTSTAPTHSHDQAHAHAHDHHHHFTGNSHTLFANPSGSLHHIHQEQQTSSSSSTTTAASTATRSTSASNTYTSSNNKASSRTTTNASAPVKRTSSSSSSSSPSSSSTSSSTASSTLSGVK